MKDILWTFTLNGVLLLTLASSIRLGLKGHIDFPENKNFKFITTKG